MEEVSTKDPKADTSVTSEPPDENKSMQEQINLLKQGNEIISSKIDRLTTIIEKILQSEAYSQKFYPLNEQKNAENLNLQNNLQQQKETLDKHIGVLDQKDRNLQQIEDNSHQKKGKSNLLNSNLHQKGKNFHQYKEAFHQSEENLQQNGKNLHQLKGNLQQQDEKLQQSEENFHQAEGNFHQSGENFHQSGENFQQSGECLQQSGEYLQQSEEYLQQSEEYLLKGKKDSFANKPSPKSSMKNYQHGNESVQAVLNYRKSPVKGYSGGRKRIIDGKSILLNSDQIETSVSEPDGESGNTGKEILENSITFREGIKFTFSDDNTIESYIIEGLKDMEYLRKPKRDACVMLDVLNTSGARMHDLTGITKKEYLRLFIAVMLQMKKRFSTYYTYGKLLNTLLFIYYKSRITIEEFNTSLGYPLSTRYKITAELKRMKWIGLSRRYRNNHFYITKAAVEFIESILNGN